MHVSKTARPAPRGSPVEQKMIDKAGSEAVKPDTSIDQGACTCGGGG